MNIELRQANAENAVNTAQHRMDNLRLQLQLKNKEIASLEDRISKHEDEHREYAQTLLCINRLWAQLNSDIVLMCERQGTPSDQPPGEASTSESDEAALGAVADPFLRRLLAGDPSLLPAVKGHVDAVGAQLSDVELLLQQRAQKTLGALTALLAAADAAKAAAAAELRAALSAAAAGDDAGPAPVQALAQDNERLRGQVAALEAQLGAVRGEQRAARARVALAEDRREEALASLQTTNNDLADVESQLKAAQRKVERLQQAAAGGGGAGASAGGAAGPGAGAPQSGGGGGGGQQSGGGGGGDEASQNELVALRTQVEVLQLQAAAKQAELDRLTNAFDQTSRQLRSAEERLKSEVWVEQTQLWARRQQEVAALRAQLEARQVELASLARERDEALRGAEARAQQLERERMLRERLAQRDAQHDAHARRAADLADALRRAEGALAAERARAGDAGTVAELKVMVATLQKEAEELGARLARDKAAGEQLDAAKARAAEASTALAARDAEVARLQARLREAAAAAASGARSARERELRERMTDLQAFVEAVTSFTSDPRDLVDLRSSEAKLRHQVAALTAQLDGHELQALVEAARGAEAAAAQQLEQAQRHADELAAQVASLDAQVSELNGEVTHLKEQIQIFLEEIGATTGAYEEMQAQNTRLLQHLTEKDEAAAALQVAHLALQQQLAETSEQLEAARQEAAASRSEVEHCASLREAAAKDAERLAGELDRVREQLRGHVGRLEGLGRELAAEREASAQLQVKLAQATELAAAREAAHGDEAAAGAEERAKRRRLEDEVQVLSAQVERLRRVRSRDDELALAEAQVESMRALLHCSLCSTRYKDTIITKCMHLACRECIDARLNARNRKCPSCNLQFSSSDVRHVAGLSPA